MAGERVERRSTWNDRVFEAIPLAPILVVAGVTLVLLLLFLATVWATGDLAEFARTKTRWWQDRDARLVVRMALLVYAITTHTRCFSRMARGIPEVDLSNLRAFSPFMSQASLFALPGIVVLSSPALNLSDRGFLWAIGILGLAALTWTTVSLLFLMRGVRDRVSSSTWPSRLDHGWGVLS